MIGARVSQRVIVQEQSGCDVEGDEDVDGVVLVRRQDEEDAKQVEDPGEGVDEIPVSWGVCWGNKQKLQSCTDWLVQNLDDWWKTLFPL